MTPQERERWVRLMGARQEWWALRAETAIAPDRDVVDAHVHFWPEREFPDPTGAAPLRTSRYMPEDFDDGGHAIAQLVYVECGNGYLSEGPAPLRATGESAFAADLARRHPVPPIAAVVGHADMRDPDLDTAIDAHVEASGGLLRGLRHSAARLEDPTARLLAGTAEPGLTADTAFQRGVARLGERGLVFDAFFFHHQLGEAAALARAVPSTTIVLNHLGGPVAYAGPGSMPEGWATGMDALAACPNVVVKLGGLASLVTGYDRAGRDRPPSSQEFVAERAALFRHAINRFGPDRCMFESNFPVDSTSIAYGTLWNAFKIIADAQAASDADALLAGTARAIYRLPVPDRKAHHAPDHEATA